MRTSFTALTAISLLSKALAGTIDNSDVESAVDVSVPHPCPLVLVTEEARAFVSPRAGATDAAR